MLAACLFAIVMPVLPARAERGDITEFDLPQDCNRMRPVVAGPDGNLWLAGSCRRLAIIRLTPDGEVTTFTTPPGSGDTPLDITVGPDGNLWVVEFEFGKVLRVTPEGEITVYSLRVPDGPSAIASGPDGNLWFTTSTSVGNFIGRITIDGDVTEFPLSQPSSWPQGIAAGPDGRMWFIEVTARRIGMISMDGTIEELEIPVRPVGSIALGSDGNLWFGASGADGSLIVRLTPDGELTEFPISNPVSRIVAGPDGALWATQPRVQQIVRITTEGEIEEFALPPGSWGGTSLAAGPDGNIWFTLFRKVGRLELDGATTAIPPVEPSRR
jgi:virginiamycin B lyase